MCVTIIIAGYNTNISKIYDIYPYFGWKTEGKYNKAKVGIKCSICPT